MMMDETRIDPADYEKRRDCDLVFVVAETTMFTVCVLPLLIASLITVPGGAYR